MMKAPAAVTELKATPAAQGGLSATLSFRLPTQSLNGEELTGTVDVTVKRADGSVVAEFTGKQPGEVLVMMRMRFREITFILWWPRMSSVKEEQLR